MILDVVETRAQSSRLLREQRVSNRFAEARAQPFVIRIGSGQRIIEPVAKLTNDACLSIHLGAMSQMIKYSQEHGAGPM